MSRVLYLSPGVFDKGGISRYGRYQIRALRDILGGDAVSVISLLPPDASAFEDAFAVDFASLGPSRSGKALFALASILRAMEERPSAVFSAHVNLAPLALAIARAARAPLVVDVYGMEIWTDLRPAPRLALARASRVVSDCEATRAYMADHGLCDPARVDVHWDCVDLDRFSPGDPGDVLARYGVPPANGDTVTVLTLGRLTPHAAYKGYDRLIDVIARADPRVRLVVAGEGPLRATLAARAAALGARDRVSFTGSIREGDLPAIYRACDVFSLITNAGYAAGEGIPLTPLEAAACGKAILVGDQDGSREAAEDGVSGFVLPPFDLDAIADRIERLARDSALRARMGAEARARVEREHAYPRFRERVRALLDTIGLRSLDAATAVQVS